MKGLEESVKARYFQTIKDYALPEDGYRGRIYIRYRKSIIDKYGRGLSKKVLSLF